MMKCCSAYLKTDFLYCELRCSALILPAVFHLCCLLMIIGSTTRVANATDHGKTVGPNACAECHKQEVEAWKVTHHFKTFRQMPRNTRAKQIAKRMGVRRVKSDSLCLSCHFTVQKKDSRTLPVSGISCESCHGAGQEWIKLHSNFSGKSAKTETKAEAQIRWKRADAKGMIRPGSLYRLAKNCYSCHVVPQEDLVNKGGHRAGSSFELVSWSQGEVRHNTWHSKGKSNRPASAARKRMLYLTGIGVELEAALRAVGKATARKPYAFVMAKRANSARKHIAAMAKALPEVPEIGQIAKLASAAGLKLNNDSNLSPTADSIAKLIVRINQKYDGSTLSRLDSLIPPQNKYKGRARQVGTGN